MVRIRLRRVGAKKQPSYRVVVADSRSPRDGRFIENIGFYNPRTEPPIVEINEERALYWLSQGAQPSDAVARLLEKLGILAKLAQMKAGERWSTRGLSGVLFGGSPERLLYMGVTRRFPIRGKSVCWTPGTLGGVL